MCSTRCVIGQTHEAGNNNKKSFIRVPNMIGGPTGYRSHVLEPSRGDLVPLEFRTLENLKKFNDARLADDELSLPASSSSL